MRLLSTALVLILLSSIVGPGLAFTSDTLTIDVREDGGARVAFTYSLTWLEQFAVFFQIADPAEEFQKAVEGLTGQEVEVQEATGSSIVFTVDRFAGVENEAGERIFTTPELRFPAAGNMLRRYWFAPLVQADFSPEITTIRFPDGSTEVWHGEEIIPSVIYPEPRYLTAEIVC